MEYSNRATFTRHAPTTHYLAVARTPNPACLGGFGVTILSRWTEAQEALEAARAGGGSIVVLAALSDGEPGTRTWTLSLVSGPGRGLWVVDGASTPVLFATREAAGTWIDCGDPETASTLTVRHLDVAS